MNITKKSRSRSRSGGNNGNIYNKNRFDELPEEIQDLIREIESRMLKEEHKEKYIKNFSGIKNAPMIKIYQRILSFLKSKESNNISFYEIPVRLFGIYLHNFDHVVKYYLFTKMIQAAFDARRLGIDYYKDENRNIFLKVTFYPLINNHSKTEIISYIMDNDNDNINDSLIELPPFIIREPRSNERISIVTMDLKGLKIEEDEENQEDEEIYYGMFNFYITVPDDFLPRLPTYTRKITNGGKIINKKRNRTKYKKSNKNKNKSRKRRH